MRISGKSLSGYILEWEFREQKIDYHHKFNLAVVQLTQNVIGKLSRDAEVLPSSSHLTDKKVQKMIADKVVEQLQTSRRPSVETAVDVKSVVAKMAELMWAKRLTLHGSWRCRVGRQLESIA